MRDISKYVDTESPLYDKLLRLYDENKDFPLENTKGRNVHHIVLRSWSRIDGEETDNTEENLVSLTAADHILAHFYIWKISKSPYRRSAASAWYFMSRTLIKFGIDENTIICLIDKYNEEIKLCDEERRKNMPESQKKKISKAMKGKRLSEETKRKIAENLRGRKLSEETRKKMSKAQKGKPSNNKGKKFSEEHKMKIAESNKGKKHKPHSKETKNRISEAFKGKHWKLVDGKRVWY